MLDRFTSISEILKNFAIFVVVLLGGVYFILNVWGNIAIAQASKPAEDSYPSVSKAQYQVTIRTTGQLLFTKEYEQSGDTYNLNKGYYQERDGKWVWTKSPLSLDETIWGDIEVTRR